MSSSLRPALCSILIATIIPGAAARAQEDRERPAIAPCQGCVVQSLRLDTQISGSPAFNSVTLGRSNLAVKLTRAVDASGKVVERTYTGIFPHEEFDAFQAGFSAVFGLDASYIDGFAGDRGTLYTLIARRPDGRAVSVISRDGAGPDVLRRMRETIEAFDSATSWVEDPGSPRIVTASLAPARESVAQAVKAAPSGFDGR